MGMVKLLDCTLRDGGYINNWEFGIDGITSIINKLEQTGIEIIEVGFIKGNQYDCNKTLFPDVISFAYVIQNKKPDVMYVGMIDMSNPIPVDRIGEYDGSSIDGIRVIFKKNKYKEAFAYCKKIKKLGYKLFVNFVNTDVYTDKEFIEGIELFNQLQPYGMAIVDTFGSIKRRHFRRLVAIADNNMAEGISLCYHAHNNLQQAFGNAEELVEMNLKRDVIIDACVFGMGRGAGNLNLELFAEYINENYDKKYRISPMLEIMDEYLCKFYRERFWGYSLPLYLSASLGCHPNYAIYLAEKNTLSEKNFNEILLSISPEDKLVFTQEKAEMYYRRYFNSFYDDKQEIEELEQLFFGKTVMLLAPGQTLKEYEDQIKSKISNEMITVAIHFYNDTWRPEFVFSSNIRRFTKLLSEKRAKIIATSNIPNHDEAAYSVNFSTFTGNYGELFDNAGLLVLRLLDKLGVEKVYIAGMDGYNDSSNGNYINIEFEPEHISKADVRNEMMSKELCRIASRLQIEFITPTKYQI